MTSAADFTADEWNLILQAPAFAALYIVQSDIYSRPVALQKMMAGIRAIVETASPGARSELVRAVREAIRTGQRPRYPDIFPTNLVEARQLSLEGCRQAALLLSQRAPAGEAAEYARWLVAIGHIVAAVPDDPLPPGHSVEQAAERARAALQTLASTLQA